MRQDLDSLGVEKNKLIQSRQDILSMASLKEELQRENNRLARELSDSREHNIRLEKDYCTITRLLDQA